MHQLNVLILGPSSFISTLNELKPFLKFNSITEKIVKCTDHSVFNTLLLDHEKIIGALLQQTPVQELLFPDFMGAIKSLGAWGGDFILASGNQKTPNYFHEKGFKTVIPYSEMIFGS